MKHTFHIVSLPHTQTTAEFSWCAYTQKVVKFCNMMHDAGHNVILYSGEENEARCSEHVVAVTKAQQREWFEHLDWKQDVFDGWEPAAPWWVSMTTKAAHEITRRAQSRDFVGIISGRCQQLLAHLGLQAVEWGVGYEGVANGTWRAYESHAWAHHVAGLRREDNFRHFDDVIPNFFEVEDFPAGGGGGDFVFLGRVIRRKGVHIAAEVCKLLGARLLLAGQGVKSAEPGRIVATDGTVLEGDVHHVGTVGPAERAKLLGAAKAVFLPTTYLEPFGGAAVEAMLCGTPAITTDWGAFTETVQQGISGFRCRTLQEFTTAAVLAAGLDRRHVRTWAMQYSTKNVLPRFERFFDRLSTLHEKGWYQVDEHLTNSMKTSGV